MSIFIFSLLGVFFISITSLLGVTLLALNKNRLAFITWVLLGVSTGALFGDVFFHLLPELIEEHEWNFWLSVSVLLGIISFFVVEKFVHWHHCHNPEHSHSAPENFATMSLLGDALHNLIDGMIIAGSFIVSIPVGIATTVAVFLHELPQEMGDMGVLLQGGYTKSKAILFNWTTSIISAFGVLLIFAVPNIEKYIAYITAFAIGVFIYIAGSDLIPALHKETNTKKSVYQFISIIVGLLIMASMLFLE